MKRIFGIILWILFLFFSFNLQLANADSTTKTYNVNGTNITVEVNPNPILINDGNLTITLTADKPSFVKDKNYTFAFFGPGETVRDKNNFDPAAGNTFNARSQIVKPQDCQDSGCTVLVAVQNWRNYGPMQTLQKKDGIWNVVIFLDNFDTGRIIQDNIQFSMLPLGDLGQGIPAIAMKQSMFQTGSQGDVFILNAAAGTNYTLWFDGEQSALWTGQFKDTEIVNDPDFGILGLKTAHTKINMGSATAKNLCMSLASATLNSVVGLGCDYRLKGIVVTVLPPSNPGVAIYSNQTGFPQTTAQPIPPGPCDPTFCKTALGDISTDPSGFVKSIFGIILSLAGGVAVILIMISGYSLMFSQGNPEKVQAAREQLTAAIVGLLFIIFSMTILEIIGIDILHIPGLTR